MRVDQVGCFRILIACLPPKKTVLELSPKWHQFLMEPLQKAPVRAIFEALRIFPLAHRRGSNEHYYITFSKRWCFLFMMRQYMCSCFIACNAYLFKLFRFDKIMLHFAFLRNLHVQHPGVVHLVST